MQLLSFDFMGVYDYESLSLGRVEPKRGEGQSGLLTVRLCSGEEKALPSLTLGPPSSWEGEGKLMRSNNLNADVPCFAGRGSKLGSTWLPSLQ